MVANTTRPSAPHAVGAPPGRSPAEIYFEVLTFYARQMRLLEALRIEDYAATFTEDAVIEHKHRGERAEGRAEMLQAMRAALPRYEGVVVRHWFDHILVEPGNDETYSVSYFSLVTRTDTEGGVTLEPTFTVEDVLVRERGELLTKSRSIRRDSPVEAAS
ncbi:actinorhodin biosynthesis protein ActVIA [Prauserella shujinwangii]|uniref:Actinorhodin biosynthesis protein ActVIA n=1 Tax=Prauserella shujinwangii TaxID=1453103 RepID=A0A2T0M3V3_9PSEU|nr:nuclear transport factor 2 family protein [Prauserella shujinwangii]PRX51434.1 actinorhodin biosynthesis protein ActVIA [Prauserella shujinwangii]